MTIRTCLLVILACVAACGVAQVVHTGRYSKINYAYVYGIGGEVYQDAQAIEDSTLLQTDFEQLMFGQSNSGVSGGNPWAAGVSTNQVHTYTRTGPATDTIRLEAQGQTDLFTHASGGAIAQMQNANPGNELIQYFTVQSPQSYYLSGQIIIPPQALPSQILLQKYNGFNWDTMYSTWWLPGYTGSFNVNSIMLPGDYRLIASIYENAFGNETDHCAYDYALYFDPFTYHVATNYTITAGSPFGGNLASIQSSNNQYVNVLNDEFDSTGTIEFTTNVTAGSITQLRFLYEGKSARNDLSQIVRLYNYATQTYTNVSVTTTTTTDNTVTGSIEANAANYVGPGRQVKAEVVWIPQFDLEGFDGWTESCDFVQWTRVP